ncbi:MAG: ABC transporter substrate-binding protein [Defluviitaleaceae bacterium]|nr:ABC transporter substrate-binding protein [Defluviitaleaceae bacterium]
MLSNKLKRGSVGKILLLVALLAVALFAFAACSNDSEEEQPAGLAPGLTLVPGGILNHVTAAEAPHMDSIRQNDAATADLTSQMFEGLLQLTPQPESALVGLLATSWTLIDEVTWEFNLREGVYFHDGEPFTADAWRWSIERAIDPREAAPGAFIIGMIDEVITIDDHTVRVVLEFPFTPILGHLSHPIAFAVSPVSLAKEVMYRLENFIPHNIYDEDDNVLETISEYVLSPWQAEALAYAEARNIALTPIMVTRAPVGTGPFRFYDRVGGDFTKIVRNDAYWGELPSLDGVRIQVVPDHATRFAMLQVGEAHTMALQPLHVVDMHNHAHLNMMQFYGLGIDYVGFNAQRAPLDDVRVRQAITKAVNIESIIIAAYEGQGVPARGPLGANVVHSAFDYLTPLPFDPDAARALLAEAGHADGLSLRFWTNQAAARETTGEIMQAYLAQVGIDLSIEIIEWGAYLDMTAAGEHDMFMLGWTTVTGDADYGIFPLFTREQWGDAGNRTFWYHPRVEELLQEGRRSTDFARRDAIYREVSEILIEEAPWIFIRNPLVSWGTNGIHGLELDANARPFFRLVSFVE